MIWNSSWGRPARALREPGLLFVLLACFAVVGQPASALHTAYPPRAADVTSIEGSDVGSATAAHLEGEQTSFRVCEIGATRISPHRRGPARLHARSLDVLIPTASRPRSFDGVARVHTHRLHFLRSGGSFIATATPPPVL
jgi:hypothetical protein